MELFFRLVSTAVFASEIIISPLPDSYTRLISPLPDKPSITFAQIRAQTPTPEVLGVAVDKPEKTAVSRSKLPAYKIAAIGDSMIDTLGPNLGGLDILLSGKYPQTQFNLYNYGVGATNIEYGLTRLSADYNYLGRDIQSLISLQPDIVVIESFGYNPFSDQNGALDRHWLAMGKFCEVIKSSLPHARIVFAVTIAPSARTFGDGAPGIAFGPQDKADRTSTIRSYIENTIAFAHSQGYPLADAYHASLDGDGTAREEFINPGDHIHYSDAGRSLMAQKISTAIISAGLLE